MHASRTLAAVLALLATTAAADPTGKTTSTATRLSEHPERSAPPARGVEGPVIRGVTVRDLDGRVAWRGDVDLGPALARIERGERDEHRGDGAVFGNRERRLPERPRGWYREYVVRTPGLRGPVLKAARPLRYERTHPTT